ncbi:type IV pili methyl-accepting chemotaxis transducer N-terminal domain-containing protein [Polaribacter sp. KT 15]|uniref:type IV pili methyl-accepting chemotaxis transducer N-terminal domain-containing protein n=1 Tax=Polaribacter sp. KT 15 TaxID=1896175 RepID=UPI00090C8489|nr:type IV pili methyl-accepting chemotaxis transducer N-terminal domain-containing protein [Polaribacter sp. KT 15]SHM80987.1 Type IV pili methyl-accepting chemotaxis transducer N-term [Polaribacter sp. KT 15]
MKKKVTLSFILFTLLVVSNQIIFHFDIKRQSYDAEIINKAGKQRMYSQKLTKDAFFASNAKNTDSFEDKMLDFRETYQDFKIGNYYINNIVLKFYNNQDLNDLYKENQSYYKNLEDASSAILNDIHNDTLFVKSVKTIRDNENGFLVSMDKIVEEYQKMSEIKVNKLQQMQLLFHAASFLLLLYVLFFIIIPIFGRETKSIV